MRWVNKAKYEFKKKIGNILKQDFLGRISREEDAGTIKNDPVKTCQHFEAISEVQADFKVHSIDIREYIGCSLAWPTGLVLVE